MGRVAPHRVRGVEDVTSASVGGWFLEVEGRRIALRGGEITIGRSRGCGVVLRDPSVSRSHALLSAQAAQVTLQDLGSSNGTYVNGKRLEQETPLAEGDRVVIGETALYLRRGRPGNDPTPVTSEGVVFCPGCGRPLDSKATVCPGCGAELDGARLPRRSEALGLGEVLPVGEVLGSASASWEQTTYRQGAASRLPSLTPSGPLAAPASGAPADPATEEAPPALSELPMSVREAERSPVPTPPRPLTPLAPLTPESGLLQRLAERLGLNRR